MVSRAGAAVWTGRLPKAPWIRVSARWALGLDRTLPVRQGGLCAHNRGRRTSGSWVRPHRLAAEENRYGGGLCWE